MSILTRDQRAALYGRLLGLPVTSAEAIRTEAPERLAPTGTVAGTEPAMLGAQFLNNRTVMIVAGVAAIVGVLWLARKVL